MTVRAWTREHFKPGARKGRGVVHLIGWAASWNTILSPKLTMSTFGFAGFTRCSGGAFSYDPTAPWPIFTSSCRSASSGRTSISIAFASARRTTPCHALAGSAATMHGKSSWGTCTFASMNASCMSTISAIYGNTRWGIEKGLEIEASRFYPVCLGGQWAGPPEDCGGPQAFLNLFLDFIAAY